MRYHLSSFHAAVLLLATACSGDAGAGEDYFMLVFGSQRVPNNSNYSHSFATFVRVTWPDGLCDGFPTWEDHTISWLPRDLTIHTWAPRPEDGHNFDLHPTLRYVHQNAERISLWGPFRIQPELYWRAMRQMETLRSGQVRYKAIDSGYRTSRVSNCIHAVGSLSQGYRLRVASPGWGETASYLILRALEPWVVRKEEVHPWVGAVLGLGQYPIIYREWEPPRSGGIRGPFYRARGGERSLEATYGDPRLGPAEPAPGSP